MTDDTVLVKRGPNGNVYHKNEDGTPPCCVTGNSDDGDWMEWSKSKADAWKTPCQNSACYGESVVSTSETSDEAWPV